MRHDENLRIIQMIPVRKITNASVSAGTYGSGGTLSKGIIDLAHGGPWDRLRIEVGHGIGNSKIKTFHIFTLSAASYAVASGTVLSGYASGAVMSAKTASQCLYGFDLNLANITHKRYLSVKIVTSTTSCPFHVTARLTRGGAFPPTNRGYTSLTRIG